MPGTRHLIASMLICAWAGSETAAQTTTLVEGHLSSAENTCVSPAQFFQFTHFQLCSYSGGVDISSVVSAAPALDFHNWMGPMDSGGFYPKNFLASPRVDGGYSGSMVGDGKIALAISGRTGHRRFRHRNARAMTRSAARWSSAPANAASTRTTAGPWNNSTASRIRCRRPRSAARRPNAFGGYDYVIGSAGFPFLIKSAAGPYPSEAAFDSATVRSRRTSMPGKCRPAAISRCPPTRPRPSADLPRTVSKSCRMRPARPAAAMSNRISAWRRRSSPTT